MNFKCNNIDYLDNFIGEKGITGDPKGISYTKKNKREDIIIKSLEDISMCLKRISDFLSDKGYRETRKYIDRLEYDLNILKEK